MSSKPASPTVINKVLLTGRVHQVVTTALRESSRPVHDFLLELEATKTCLPCVYVGELLPDIIETLQTPRVDGKNPLCYVEGGFIDGHTGFKIAIQRINMLGLGV